MAGGKETPRQKMIGMMYLVLTALLALNVSKEILDAFVVVNNGLVQTDKNFKTNNALLYNSIEAQLSTEPERAKGAVEASRKLKKWANETHQYIADLKKELIAIEDQIAPEAAAKILDSLANVQNKDKYDNATRIMCGDGTVGSKGKATDLKNKLIEYKKNLISILPESVKKSTNLGLKTDDPPKKGTEVVTWESEKFYHLPVAAQIVVLSQLQTEIRNAEGTVLNELFKSIGAKTIKVDKLAAQLVPSANVVAIGEEFTAKIFVAALNTSSIPDVSVNGGKVSEVDENGFVVFRARPSSEGEQTVRASVRFTNADGNPETSEKEFTYTAVKPTAVVSPTAMMVFYVGVDNPVDISVPGAAPDKIDATLQGCGGTLTKVSNGKYIARVTSTGKCSVSVSVRRADGKGTVNMGAQPFMAKKLPDPIPMLASTAPGGLLDVNTINQRPTLAASLPEDFVFKGAVFQVLEYEFEVQQKGNLLESVKVTGNRLDSKALSALSKAKPKGKIYINSIKVKGPDQVVRTLNVMYKLN
jgi:gliding motility-associated protein GldM